MTRFLLGSACGIVTTVCVIYLWLVWFFSRTKL